jgi:hypothetical protein
VVSSNEDKLVNIKREKLMFDIGQNQNFLRLRSRNKKGRVVMATAVSKRLL